MSDTIDKVSVIISRGSLEGVYPGLIMANGARMEGIDANVFFTFFGLDAINRAKHDHVKVATVGEPGLHLATWLGGFPGMSSLVTHQLAGKMEELDIPPIPEFVEMISDSGARPLRLQGFRRPVRTRAGRLHRPGRRRDHRRRVLPPRRRRPDHLHLNAGVPDAVLEAAADPPPNGRKSAQPATHGVSRASQAR